MLKNEADIMSYLPINPNGDELFEKVKDGVLLWYRQIYNLYHYTVI